VDKCEIITDDFTEISTLAMFNDFIRVNKEDMSLLGAPVLKGKAQDKAIQDKIDDLTRAVERLKHVQAHDALVILKNSLAIPKLLYLLRTSQCSDSPLLRQFDDTLQTGLITILNEDINSDPVGDGGLGIWSAEMLAPSAYLASAASTLLLQQSISLTAFGCKAISRWRLRRHYGQAWPTHQSPVNKHNTSRKLGMDQLQQIKRTYSVPDLYLT